ncbi:alpha-amylase family glycosyl hydrolase [Paenibacillus sp.]|uniref:alpha-amylase family glycosyl hydrolase n=1 Tax=Paenibacillus sp. TaxID=58172 RepID=UPI002D5EF9F2|nr:alpha-amylase family glycosyl hydrolase [Paenibacillus sp.]HZG56331.1 alpha-amylase family glycosyl hydrolase [Paenibacillus sp.]
MKTRWLRLWGSAATALAMLAGCAGGAATNAEPPTRVFYEIFVRSFYDSNGDGIGDLNGVTEKLDYLESLGAEGLWLMPVHASSSYHGYDVIDYYAIQPEYGTIEDMKRLLEEAERRNIKVIMDLVVNHTGVEHPWFAEASQGPGSEKRDWYVWADEGDDTSAISATGGKAWHAKNGSHYLGVFWDGMPDLNMDHPDVRKTMIEIGTYWLKLGVDGFRLDAAKHVYEDFEGDGKDPETSKKNVAWWQSFRAAMEEANPNVLLIGEVWDGPAVVAPYFDGAMSSVFNFELAQTVLDMANAGKAYDIAPRLEKIHALYADASGGAFVDSVFLANHDQNRVMSVLGGDENKARVAASLLLTLPGHPFLYYGEEIGMQGMKPDEYIREPMPWTNDRSAPGNTSWLRPKHNADGSPTVEAALADKDSLYHHYRRLIEYRKKDPALRGGALQPLKVGGGLESFLRVPEDGEASLVIHNVSPDGRSVDLAEVESASAFRKLSFATSPDAVLDGTILELPGYSTVVLKQ